jgi:hypothetical protein
MPEAPGPETGPGLAGPAQGVRPRVPTRWLRPDRSRSATEERRMESRESPAVRYRFKIDHA